MTVRMNRFLGMSPGRSQQVVKSLAIGREQDAIWSGSVLTSAKRLEICCGVAMELHPHLFSQSCARGIGARKIPGTYHYLRAGC